MLHQLKNLLLYAGLEKEEYDALSERITRENLNSLAIYTFLGFCAFLLLDIASTLTTGYGAENRSLYLTFTLIMLGFMLTGRFLAYRHERFVKPYMYLFQFSLYSFSLAISALHPASASAAAMVYLVASPLLFYDRPANLMAITTILSASICLFAKRYKTPDAAEIDVWNAASFGLLAFGTTILTMRTKVQALAKDRKIQHLSETDLLTGLKNRNCFENSKINYPYLCQENVVCVYADANGLHELNNEQGHDAGDRMLQTVAREMQSRFGDAHTYRVGGDEFVAFVPDREPEAVRKQLEEMQEQLSRFHYHVSFGLSSVRREQADMDSIVKQAEEEMFLAKRIWYQQTGHNRRRSRV